MVGGVDADRRDFWCTATTDPTRGEPGDHTHPYTVQTYYFGFTIPEADRASL
jgi:hypothetical protein